MDNPFSGMRANSGSLFANLGLAPTYEDVAGQATGEANSALGALIEGGLTPQQAIVKYLQTPEGMQAFIRNPNLADQMQKTIASVTPPKEDVTTLSPGQTALGTDPYSRTTRTMGSVPAQPQLSTASPGQKTYSTQNGQTREVGNNPSLPQINNIPAGNTSQVINQDGTVASTTVTSPAEVQTFNALTKVAQLNPTELEEMARIQLLPADQRKSAAERAVKRLVDGGQIDATMGQKLLAGALDIKEVHNNFGDGTGQFVITDKLGGQVIPSQNQINPDGSISPNPVYNGATRQLQDGTSTPLNPPAPRGPQTSPQPGAQGPSVAPSSLDLAKDKRSMFLGTGALAATASYLGATAKQFDPSINDPKSESATTQRDYLGQLHTALIALRDNASGLGIPVKVIDQALSLAPGFGPLENPKEATKKGIMLLNMAENEIARGQMNIRDPNQPRALKIKEAERIQSWKRVTEALPTKPEMIELYKDIESGKANTMGIGGAAESAANLAKSSFDALNKGIKDVGEQNQPATKYQKMNEDAMIKVDVTKLQPNELRAYKTRLQELIKAKGNKKATDMPFERTN